jgi:hypothetical protein
MRFARSARAAGEQYCLDLEGTQSGPVGAVEERASVETPETIFIKVFRTLKPRTPIPAIHIDWRKYSSVHSSVRLEAGHLRLRISDLLQGAPAAVLEALAFILLGKMFRKPAAKAHVHRYNLYLSRREVRRDMHLIKQVRGRKFVSGPKGAVHDLEAIFADLNERYFGGMLATPALGWSRTRNRHLLGHFDPSHNAIIISRLFDHPEVEKLALEFVMYHEMLHLRFPAEYRGSRRCVHTSEFKKAEKEFTGWKEASTLLKRL